MTRLTMSFAIIAVLLLSNAAVASKLKVEPDEENVVASRLEGAWHMHSGLTQRLAESEESPFDVISFSSDPKVAGLISNEYVEIFTEMKIKIYMAGYCKFDNEKVPFILTQISGNPHIVVWFESDGDQFADSESCNVMLAVAEDQKNDLLFIGGDFNNQPFSAFERVETKAKE